ncbi:MAG: SIS domain-containing protein [Planctomycetes bacterium]|nr:SIS domain-containing protein [Planctomycetota bacterium]
MIPNSAPTVLRNPREHVLNETHLYREIHEQPAVLRTFLREQRDAVRDLARAMRERNVTHVVIAARGTSDNAGRYAQYVLGANDGVCVGLTAPSLFTMYERPPRFGNALVLGISQSGKSPDIVAVLREAKRQGVLTAVMTNVPGSDLALQGDHVIHLCAGDERAVAATKTYTSELAAIALLSAALGDDPARFDALDAIPDAVEDTLRVREAIASIAPRYRYMDRSVAIGRGFNYATAFELALKLKELTYTLVEPYSSADFLHGPLAMLEPGFPVIVVAPQGELAAELRAFVAKVRERGAEIVAISDDRELLGHARIPLALPHAVPEWLSPITSIVPGQLLAMYLADARDFDVDAPRAIHKVTETH